VRVTIITSVGDTINPRLALIYDPFKNEKSVIKAICGAFRPISLSCSLTESEPERSTYELVYEQQI
jgi:hypothetical protein